MALAQWSRAAHLAAVKSEVISLQKARPVNGVISIAGNTEQNAAVSLLPFALGDQSPHRKLLTVPTKPSLDELTLRLGFDSLPQPWLTKMPRIRRRGAGQRTRSPGVHSKRV